MTQMPPQLAALSDGFYRQQQSTTKALATAVQVAWGQAPTDGLRKRWQWWDTTVPLLADKVTDAQMMNAARAAAYVTASATVQGVESTDVPTVQPEAFLSASDDVESWLDGAMGHYTSLITQGASSVVAQQVALSTLIRMASTLAQDAGREAAGVGISAHPNLSGYFRRLKLPSCSRCAILAGRWYRHDNAFNRHPLCDCVHVPAAEAYDDGGFDPRKAIESGQVTGLSKGDREALADGADLNQVVNAKRKGAVSTTSMYGDKVQVTTEGMTRRGLAGQRSGNFVGRKRVASKVRLTPSEIYRQAGSDKDLARRLLEKHGYVV